MDETEFLVCKVKIDSKTGDYKIIDNKCLERIKQIKEGK